MNKETTNWPRIATYVALVAALLGAVADVLLLYNPAGGYELNDYVFTLDIPPTRMLIGHYLGIFFIPLEMLGLFQVYRALKPAGPTLSWGVIISALYLGFPGVVYHATVGFTASFLRSATNNPAVDMQATWEYVRLLSDPLAAVLPVGFFIMSGLLIYTILKQPTLYPRWMAACTPLTFYLLCVLAYLVVPSVGTILAPAGFNLSFFFFFAISLWAEKTK